MPNFNRSPHKTLQEYFDDLIHAEPESEQNRNGSTQTQGLTGFPQTHQLTPLARLESRAEVQVASAKPTLLTDDFLNTFARVETSRTETLLQPNITQEQPLPEPNLDTKDFQIQSESDPTDESILAAASADEAIDPTQLQWIGNRPPWAQGDFDALLLEVGDFKVAVPLITLGHIHRISEQLTPIFGQAPWFMGLQVEAGQQLRVVNTPLFIMPEKYHGDFSRVAEFVVTIGGLSWALAVSKVNQPIRLSANAVRWRAHSHLKEEGTKQPWAAGIVKEHMCVLIDIPRLGKMLLDCAAKRSRSN